MRIEIQHEVIRGVLMHVLVVDGERENAFFQLGQAMAARSELEESARAKVSDTGEEAS